MRYHVRSILTAFLIAASVLAFSTGVLGPVLPPYVGRPDLERFQHHTCPARPILRVRNNQGAVTVVASRGTDRIDTRARIRGYERTDGAAQAAEAYAVGLVKVEEAGEVVRLVADPEERPEDIELQVDLNVSVPPGTDIEVENGSGNVWVRAGCGDVKINGRNTDIRIEDPKGQVNAASTNGRVKVTGALADTTLETVNGSIQVQMAGGSLRAATINGTISARVLQPEVRYCELNAQNGDIRLFLNKECSAFLEATTERGEVGCAFPVDTSHGLRKRKHLEGNIGAGRMYISTATLNGDIWIYRSDR